MDSLKPFELTMRLRNNLLKGRRVALGMTSEAFAKRLGISVPTYSKLENMRMTPLCKRQFGQTEPIWRRTVLKLADFYKCTPVGCTWRKS